MTYAADRAWDSDRGAESWSEERAFSRGRPTGGGYAPTARTQGRPQQGYTLDTDSRLWSHSDFLTAGNNGSGKGGGGLAGIDALTAWAWAGRLALAAMFGWAIVS